MDGYEYVEALKLVRALDFFLITAPVNWHENQIIRRYYLNKEEGFVSCVYWNNLYFITGTDIVRCIAYKMHHLGRKITDRKKFEEGIFSDLRSLKSGSHAVLEDARSLFLRFLHKNQCLRTQKKQKVFFWFSVPHQKLFSDVLERDLKRELSNQTPTTVTTNPIMKSFKFDQSGKPILEQYADHVKNVSGHSVNQLILKTIPDAAQPSAITPSTANHQLQTPMQQYQPTPIQMQQYALASAQDETFLMNLFDGELNTFDPISSPQNDPQQFVAFQSQLVNNNNAPRYALSSNGQLQMVSPVYPIQQQQLVQQHIQQNKSSSPDGDKSISQPQVISASYPNNYFVLSSGLTPVTRAPSLSGINQRQNQNQQQQQQQQTHQQNIPRLPSLTSATFPHLIPLMISPNSMLNNDLTLESNKESTDKDSKDQLTHGNSNQRVNSLLLPVSGIPGEFNSINSATFNQYFPNGVIEDLSTSNNENPNNGSLSSITNSNSFILGQIFTPSTINFLDNANNNNILQSNINHNNNEFSPVIGFKNGLLNANEKSNVIDSGKILKQSFNTSSNKNSLSSTSKTALAIANASKRLLNPTLRHLDVGSIYEDDDDSEKTALGNSQLTLSSTKI